MPQNHPWQSLLSITIGEASDSLLPPKQPPRSQSCEHHPQNRSSGLGIWATRTAAVPSSSSHTALPDQCSAPTLSCPGIYPQLPFPQQPLPTRQPWKAAQVTCTAHLPHLFLLLSLTEPLLCRHTLHSQFCAPH